MGLTTVYVELTGARRVDTNGRSGYPSVTTDTMPVGAKMATPIEILKHTTGVRTYDRLHFVSFVLWCVVRDFSKRE